MRMFMMGIMLGNAIFVLGELFVNVIVKMERHKGDIIIRKAFLRLVGFFMALVIIWMIEVIVFQQKVCFGISCSINIQHMLRK